MIITAILGIALTGAWAQTPLDASQSLWQLHDAFVSSTDQKEQMDILNQISQTKPVSPRDMADLFDLFVRYPQTQTRNAAISALDHVGPADYAFAPMLLDYLAQPEPKTRFFAVLAELRLRDPKALPIIKSIAEQKFSAKSAERSPFPERQDEWWAQYEALDALALWQGQTALSLAEKQALAAPSVARIMAAHFWAQALPLFVDWANSSEQNKQDAAHEGLSASVPAADLSPTRDKMLDFVLDQKEPEDVRHYLAVKVGLCSDENQVSDLIQRRTDAKDEKTKLYLLGAIYASRSPQAIPLLIDDAKTNPETAARRGALVELKELMKPEDYRAVALWVSQNDADPDLRNFAQDDVSTSTGPIAATPAAATPANSKPQTP